MCQPRREQATGPLAQGSGHDASPAGVLAQRPTEGVD
jgi:hypothetical protein